jgi:hypothetical protein
MERALEQVSSIVRYRKGPYYVRKYGGPYGPRQKRVAAKHNRLRRYLELDFFTCLFVSRILLDRAIALSRVFLIGGQLPSFTSFSDHKKFFASGARFVPGHEEYARYMREETAWFDLSIKFVRDKFFVHQGPRHTKAFTIPGWGHEDDLVLTFFLLDMERGKSDFGRRTMAVRFNPLRLSYDVEAFLKWFATYGEHVITIARSRDSQGIANQAVQRRGARTVRPVR